MINISKQNESIVFEFHDNPWYLNDGTIECPVNSLTLVDDGSGMVTFMKAGSADILCSAPAEEFGMTVDELVDWFKVNGCSAGGGSAIKELYLGTAYDTVDASTCEVTKYEVGDVVSGHTIVEEDFHYLIYVYTNENHECSLTAVDMDNYITENEFRSGTTVVNHVVRGVVDPRTEKVYTAYDASGNPTTSASVLTLNASGFTVDNIQKAIDEASKKTVRKVAKKAEYVWDSVQQKMVLKLYDEYDVLINGINFFDTNDLGQILLPNTVF